VFGEGVLPAYLPMLADDGTPAGLLGLLTERIHDYSHGARVEREPDRDTSS
jgi:elongation factor G